MSAAELAELQAENERLRQFEAVVRSFVLFRGEVIAAIENCPPDNTSDYWRWQGHAESRRELIGDLPWGPDDDLDAIKRQARLIR